MLMKPAQKYIAFYIITHRHIIQNQPFMLKDSSKGKPICRKITIPFIQYIVHNSVDNVQNYIMLYCIPFLPNSFNTNFNSRRL